jgi:hypothetical protein
MNEHSLVGILYILLELGIYNLMIATRKGRNMYLLLFCIPAVANKYLVVF